MISLLHFSKDQVPLVKYFWSMTMYAKLLSNLGDGWDQAAAA
jgi:hypothetical protein